MDPIALVCAVDLEAAPVLDRLDEVEPVPIRHRSARSGCLDGRPVILLAGGMGKTNAAQALTSLLERSDVSGLIGFGVGGAYPGSGLNVGDLALATSQHYGDEGVEMGEGWLSCAGIGIPLAEIGGVRHFNDFPVDQVALGSIAATIERGGARVRTGPFVTVSACSGTAARGAVLAARFDAVCETMEGAAYAHIAALYGVPYLEVRGISNLVEDRDTGSWRPRIAAEAAAEAVASIVATWTPSANLPPAPTAP